IGRRVLRRTLTPSSMCMSHIHRRRCMATGHPPMTFSGFIRVIQDYVGTNRPENQELSRIIVLTVVQYRSHGHHRRRQATPSGTVGHDEAPPSSHLCPSRTSDTDTPNSRSKLPSPASQSRVPYLSLLFRSEFVRNSNEPKPPGLVCPSVYSVGVPTN